MTIADLLDAVADALEHHGEVVIRASNGAELIDRLADSGPFDLVVTDVAMPWLNGIRAMRAARTAGLRTSVIVMTALRDQSLRRQVDALGGSAALLEKPFDLDELEAAVTNLLNRAAEPLIEDHSMNERSSRCRKATHVFPPALVPLLHDWIIAKGGCLADVPDGVLVQLLTTVFWAGLESYEGDRHSIGVVFLGTSAVDFVVPEGAGPATVPLYQWKIDRFESPRPYTVGELAKLAVTGVHHGIYSAINMQADGTLVIAGMAREGINVESDPFITVVASHAGCLSIRNGRELLLAYERGAVLTGGEDVLFSGQVLHALETMAHTADPDGVIVADYVHAVRTLVRAMAAHGHGGILVITAEARPEIAEGATYHMARDSSLASFLRLSRRIASPTHGNHSSQGQTRDAAFGGLLRSAFLSEAERITEQIGALTAIDGATLLNGDLALISFGAMLPLGRAPALAETVSTDGGEVRPVDLAHHGTRHHAAAAYAANHPGSVVFVASEDGQVSCIHRAAANDHTLIRRLRPAETRVG